MYFASGGQAGDDWDDSLDSVTTFDISHYTQIHRQ